MGLSASKEFSDLFIAENGNATSEDNLKKLKIIHVLASGVPAPKNNKNWKNLELENNNEQTVIINLKAGARFIHQGRVNKENVLIVTEPQNNDSTAFLVAYFMLLSGLPVKCAKEAVGKLNDKVKVTNRYDKELEEIRNSNTAKILREELLKTSGTYPQESLTDDVKKIYRLANITPPSPEEIRLEDARRISIIEAAWAKAAQEKELADNVDKPKKLSISSPSPSPGARGSFLKRFSIDLKKDTETKTKESPKVSDAPNKVESPKVETPSPLTKDIKPSSPGIISPMSNGSKKSEENLTNYANATTIDKLNKPLENGAVNDQNVVKKQYSQRVSITYALSPQPTGPDPVDEYLRTHSEEERERSRRRVTITRALSKSVDE